MSFTRLLLAGALVTSLTGCTSGLAMAGFPTTQISAVGAPMALSAPPLSGRAMLKDAPFAGAQIRVTRVGDNTVLATATTGADGAFSLAVPAVVPEGVLLRVTATGDGATLAAIAAPTTASQLHVQDYQPVELNLATTLAYISVQGAFQTFESAEGLSQSAPTAEQRAQVVASFQTFVQAASQSLTNHDSQDVRDAVGKAIHDDGSVTIAPEVARTLTDNDQSFQDGFKAVSEAIADAVRKADTESALPNHGSSLSFGAANDVFLATAPPAPVDSTPTPAPLITTATEINTGATADTAVIPSLGGVVTVGGQPRAHVLVELYDSQGHQFKAVTGTDGSYAFYWLVPGPYTAVFAVDGAIGQTQTVFVL